MSEAEAVLGTVPGEARGGQKPLFTKAVKNALLLMRHLNNVQKRKILDYLQEHGEQTVKQIAEEVFGTTRKYSAASGHLGTMHKLYLVDKRGEGTRRLYSINKEGVKYYNELCATILEADLE